ncbi:hypothetical protein [Arsenicicoccus dermatophilus]|uniref:hypothetical protein n=1 Tax=Arsenicicoccus dermatophilus TaxID=1076331 RepID=UPI003917645E
MTCLRGSSRLRCTGCAAVPVAGWSAPTAGATARSAAPSCSTTSSRWECRPGVQASGLGTQIPAIRDGLLTDDDEVVAHALTHAGPHLLWLTRPSPTPRGVVVCDLVASLAESLHTAAVAVSDDAALVEDLLDLDVEEAAAQRFRAWSDGPHTAL